MLKWLQIAASLITTVPAKLIEAAKDKVVTWAEGLGVVRSVAKSLGYDQASIGTIGPKEKDVIIKVCQEITQTLEDREVTLDEILTIAEVTFDSSGLSGKAMFKL